MELIQRVETIAQKVEKQKTIWIGTAAEYENLQTDNYDLYFIEEVSD